MTIIDNAKVSMEQFIVKTERAYKMFRRGIMTYSELLQALREAELEMHHSIRDDIINEQYYDIE